MIWDRVLPSPPISGTKIWGANHEEHEYRSTSIRRGAFRPPECMQGANAIEVPRLSDSEGERTGVEKSTGHIPYYLV